LMLKEVKHSLLKKGNLELVEGLIEFITLSTKSLVEAIESDDAVKLTEAMSTPIETIETFEKVQIIHNQLREAQEAGNEDKLVELKNQLDELTS